MPIYQRLGKVPRKRHQVLARPDGGMHFEQLMGNKGFVGPSTLMYHLRYPTEVRDQRAAGRCDLEAATREDLRHCHFRTLDAKTGPSAVRDRVGLLFNDDVALYVARPDSSEEPLFRNGGADELVYVAKGQGTLHSMLGDLSFGPGDYVVIPRGIVHQWNFEGKDHHLLILESRGAIRTPERYRNEFGQLLEGSPFNERDLRCPTNLVTHDEEGEFPVLTKQRGEFTEYTLTHHPFDVVGWDGYYYPWALNIEDFEPKVAAYHLPPPVHQTFEGDGFVICSFCPRPFDFGKDAVPAPYFHSNVWTDEVIFYASDEFMSRKGIGFGSITLHPDGLPHGPQPGRMEDSIGVESTQELAVMLDTFAPLKIATSALAIEDESYSRSWLED
jgi:homogentisate 1,2-dioxygenase